MCHKNRITKRIVEICNEMEYALRTSNKVEIIEYILNHRYIDY